MKIPEKAAKLIEDSLTNKTILEVACGTAVFSLAACKYAKKVIGIDIDESRLSRQVIKDDKFSFEVMDASNMSFSNRTFDTVVIYNGFAHIKKLWNGILKECRRVLANDGEIFIISTWKMDSFIIETMFPGQVEHVGNIDIVKLK